jgi:hypothetical protein
MILDMISVKRHNTVRCNDPNSNTLTELLTPSSYYLAKMSYLFKAPMM